MDDKLNDANRTKSSLFWGIFKKIRFNKGLLNIIYSLIFVFLLSLSLLTYKEVTNLIAANKWVEHTYQVINQTQLCVNNILEIESMQRGYLITNDKSYMNDAAVLNTRLFANLKGLLYLTQNNKDQNERVKEFIKLVKVRLVLLNDLVELKIENKLDFERHTNQYNKSLNASNLVKNMGREIASVEFVLLNERNSIALNGATLVNIIVIIGNIISILSLIFGFILINAELYSRTRIQSNNKAMQERLKRIIEGTSDMIAAFDKDKKIIIFNKIYFSEFKRLFGKPIQMGMSLDEAFSNLSKSQKELSELWLNSLDGTEAINKIEYEIEGKENIYEITSSFIQNDDYQVSGTVQIVRNITQRVQEHTELKKFSEKLELGMNELKAKNNQIILLVEMSDIMLACSSQDELTQVMAKFAHRLLPFASGYMYVMHPSKNYLEVALSWNKPNPQNNIFTPEQCWALKLGRRHEIKAEENSLTCEHTHEAVKQHLSHLCLPLMAQNDIYGLLYLEDTDSLFDENNKLLINAFAELAALALANVRLRENLRHQSIRDPLTGLYNRRYLNEFLFKQLHQAERSNMPLSLLMMDLDHFKKINDTFGHDAGDTVLKEVGEIIQSNIRLGDIATRYGGEEFVVLLFNIDLEATMARAEIIRQSVSMLQIKFGAQNIGPITISIGISIYPQDGKVPEELIKNADKALYVSKKSGRNKLTLFNEIERDLPKELNVKDED